MRQEYERVLGWAMPTICILVSALVLNSKRTAFVDASSRRDEATIQLARASQEEKAVASQPQERRYAAADGDNLEEARFLDDLRNRAAVAGATVVGWTSQTTTYGVEGSKEKTDEAIKGLSKVSCNLTLGGSYHALRKFIQDLSEADRLFTVSHIEWKRANGSTELAMTLGRYVAPVLLASRPIKP